MNEILQYANLGTVAVSVIGAYFYIKFKLNEVEKNLNEHKAIHKEEIMAIRASKMGLKAEIHERYDEKIAELKEQQSKVNDAIEKRLESIDTKLTTLLMRHGQGL